MPPDHPTDPTSPANPARMIAPGPGRRVIVVGDYMQDILVRPEGPPIPGADRRAEIRVTPGGSGANQAAWLAAEGVDVTLVARVGAGDLNDVKNDLQAYGITPQISGDAHVPTGSIVSMIAPDGQRSFYTSRGANDRLSPSDLPPGLLEGTALLLVSGYLLLAEPARGTLRGLIAEAVARGIPVAVDPGSASFLQDIGPAEFLDMIAGASMLIPNADEARVLAATDDPAEQSRVLAARFPLLIAKGGAGPARLYARGACIAAVEPQDVDVIDTTGAGDAFVAGFVAAWLGGQDGADCLARGHAVAARAVARMGARPA